MRSMLEGQERPSGARFGKYLIVNKLGEGAFGAVYEAQLSGPMGFEKRVALKRLRTHLTRDDPRFVQSMINEARIGGTLHHPNIVDVYEFDQVNGQYYLAMEFVEGATLDEVITVCLKRRVPLPRFAVLEILLQICRGLSHAHTKRDARGELLGLVHRDLKPSNVMLDRTGTVKVLDFGIAKASSNLYRTTMGVTKGTPPYMSPEQLNAAPLTAASDLFALGAIFYELVTGKALFHGDSLRAIVHQVAAADLTPPIDEADLEFPGSGPILRRALERDPGDRYQSARQFASDLRALVHRYPPPDADMADVVSRLVPAVVRTESRVIQHSADLTFDQDEDPAVPDPDHLDIPEAEGLPRGGDSNSSGWGRFTAAMPIPPADTVDSIPPTEPVLAMDFSQRSTAPIAPTVLNSAVVKEDEEPLSPTRMMADMGGRNSRRRSAVVLAFGLALLLAGLWLVTGSDPVDKAGETRVEGSASSQEALEVVMAEDTSGVPTENELSAPPKADAVTPTPTPTESRRVPERQPVTPRSAPAPSPAPRQPTPSPAPELELTPETVPDPEPAPAPSPESTPAGHQPGPIVIGNVTGTFARVYVDDVKVSGYTRDTSFESEPLLGGPHVVKLVCGGQDPKVFRVVVNGRTVVTPCWDCKKMTPCAISP
jgi:eukaryotic-like serine/threonine-protein kinase